MPSQGSEDGYERVFKRVCVVTIAYENVERKRDIDGKPSPIQREFQLVSVIDLLVEVSRFRDPGCFHQRCNICSSCWLVLQHCRRVLGVQFRHWARTHWLLRSCSIVSRVFENVEGWRGENLVFAHHLKSFFAHSVSAGNCGSNIGLGKCGKGPEKRNQTKNN